jgi:hypothetical protein
MLGKRYGFLPSEVLVKATTFDLEVLDIACSYEAYKHNKAQGKTPEVKQEILQNVLEEFRKNDSNIKG